MGARTLPIPRLLIWKYGGHGTDGIADRECRSRIIGAFIASANPANLPVECMDAPPLPFLVR